MPGYPGNDRPPQCAVGDRSRCAVRKWRCSPRSAPTTTHVSNAEGAPESRTACWKPSPRLCTSMRPNADTRATWHASPTPRRAPVAPLDSRFVTAVVLSARLDLLAANRLGHATCHAQSVRRSATAARRYSTGRGVTGLQQRQYPQIGQVLTNEFDADVRNIMCRAQFGGPHRLPEDLRRGHGAA